MYRWLKIVGLSIWFAGMSALAQAPASQSWNGWFYQTPPGWQAQPTPKEMDFVPAQAGPINRMRLLAAEPVQGSLSDWFMNVTRREASAFRNFHLNAVQQGTTVHGKPKVYCTGQAVTQSGQQVVISYMGVLSLDGQGLLMVSEFETLSSFRYLGAYGKFIGSLEPGTAPKLGPDRTAKRPSTGHENNGPGPGTRHKRETDQTDKPGSGPSTPVPPTSGEPLVAPKS